MRRSEFEGFRGRCDIYETTLSSRSDPDGRPVASHHDKLPDTVRAKRKPHVRASCTRAPSTSVGEYEPELFLVETKTRQRIARTSDCHMRSPDYFRRHDDALYVSRLRSQGLDVLGGTRMAC